MANSDEGPGKRRPRRRTAKEHGPDPIDKRVGRQLRLARELSGLTQVDIGKAIAMSFQVVQKYEQGEIRVSASRLFQFAKLLGKPASYFFEAPAEAEIPVNATLSRPEIELIRAFRGIDNAEIRQRLLLVVRVVSGQGPTSAGPDEALLDDPS